jgi:hypothetical protein
MKTPQNLNNKLDHIWANVPRNEFKYGLIEAYCSYFKFLVHIAFKLLNTLPMYNKKPLTSPFV